MNAKDLDPFTRLLSGDYFFHIGRGSGKTWLQNTVIKEIIKRRGIIMKESFELNAVKGEMMALLTYNCRSDAIYMLYNIMAYANKHHSISVFEIFDLNRKLIDHSWDEYGWIAEDIIISSPLIISKTEDGKYRVNLNFGLMKRLDWGQPVCCGNKYGVQYYDEMNSYPSWLNPNDICYKPIVKKEVLNEKPKEPKKHHEYSISSDSSYHISHQKDGTIGKNDYLSYSIHVDTTNPDVYHEIFDFAESLITEAQNEEEKN